ncbi:hypothetical protein RIF29_20686 [Crotalaria pallida]|uniref:Uncharacterized protein n=1 Tax=Crotalaria pallida TaxID=3830 RepID=A0AAN9F1P1_CROPI
MEPYSSSSPIAAFSFGRFGSLIAAAWCCYVAAAALNRIGEDELGNGGGTDLSQQEVERALEWKRMVVLSVAVLVGDGSCNRNRRLPWMVR